MTRVTIGMPACDSARTIGRAIASVRAQSGDDWTLIVSDDASTDGTADVVARAAAEDARIRLVRQPVRLGVLNFGVPLAMARTPFFIWLAADDWWEAGLLAALHAALAARPDAASAVPQVVWAPQTDPGPGDRDAPDPPPRRRLPPPMDGLDCGWTERTRRFLANPGGSRMYGLMRTTVARRAFPSRTLHAWDWAFVLGVLAAGPQVSVPEVTLYREETDWLSYSEAVLATGTRGINRSFPAWPALSLALRRGDVPPGALRALVRLNLNKHEEFVATCETATYARRHALYRRLGLHFASDTHAGITLMDQIAARNASRDPDRAAAARGLAARLRASIGPRTQPASPAVRTRTALPPLTAVLAVRNGAATLDRLLAHLLRHDARVIVIDHGSTDRTRAIALARQGAPVSRVIDQPFDGTFDLAAQLDLKRAVLADIRDGWVIHADADEFLDPPPAAAALGQTLRQTAAAWPGAVIAAPTRELAFLPQTDDEAHHPDTFEATLRGAVPIADHDAKQRLFRAGADLTLWRATGGHTVTTDPARIGPQRLLLRHYPGLSLDHLRGQYLSRVFAHADRARLWHSTRAAAQAFDIVPPPGDALAPVGGPEAPERPNFPVFVPRPPDPDPPACGTDADLWLAGPDPVAVAQVRALLAANFPGLRMATAPRRIASPAATLTVLSHPATATGRTAASDWVREIACRRQVALAPGQFHAETRSEDLPQAAGALVMAVRALLTRTAPTGAASFLRPSGPVARPCPDPATRAICTELGRDLGYVWADAAAL